MLPAAGGLLGLNDPTVEVEDSDLFDSSTQSMISELAGSIPGIDGIALRAHCIRPS
jgi:hypothetical protein